MKTAAFILCIIFLSMQISGCTPLVVGGAAAGGAYVGYKAKEEGYSIHITKEVKGTKGNKVNKNDNKTINE